MKLTQEDALALSYLTPGLSRRIQKQLFAQLSCPDGTQNSTLPRRTQTTNATQQHRLAESSSLGKLRYQTTLAKETSDVNVRPQQTRKVSRFLRPDFYDNAPATTATTVSTNQTNKPTENLFYKEKKEREMETQKVLKEIRDKRIKNRLSVRRERSMSREKEMAPTKSAEILMGYSKIVENKTQDVCKVAEVPKDIQEKSIPDYVNVPANKKERVSKLIRPKSYPNERAVKSPDSSSIEAPKSSKTERSLKTPEPTKVKSNSGTKNKFLQSIEKKFEKLRSLNNTPNDEPTKKSCVESAIRKLREHSVPRQSEALITESTLIKRAVSVEDCTTNASLLQPSRKSVTKILGLFKKYEDKDKAAVKQRERTKSPEATLLLNEISETNIPRPKKLSGDLTKAKSPDLVVEQHRERPKSLMIETGMKNGATSGHTNGTTEGTYKSRLPLMNNRRSLQIDDNASNNNQLSPVTPTDNRIQFSENSIINDIAQRRANQRKLNLQLDLSAANSNQLLTPDNDSSCTLLSPYDDTVSCSGDSWSACSDQGLTSQGQSHVESNGNDLDGGEVTAGESVIDRIRRKSFYSRFNDQRRSRKTSMGSGSIAGSYRDLDLYRYRDYNPPSTATSSTTPTHTSNTQKRSYSRSSSHMPDYTFTSELATATLDRKRQHNRPYGRSTSMLHEYVNMPSSAAIGCDSARGENNARLLSYTRLYHDDNNGNGYNGAGVDADGDDVDGKLNNRYRRYNYRSSSNASTRSSVSPSRSTAHVHDQPTITAINNSVVNSHLKSSTPACLHNDKY